MERCGKITFNNSNEVVEYFNDKENFNKELISVCVIAPTVFDSVFVAFYKIKE